MIRYQNIIGWYNFLQGFTSLYWNELYKEAHISNSEFHKSYDWDQKLVGAAITLYRNIWHDQNTYLQGKTRLESQQKLWTCSGASSINLQASLETSSVLLAHNKCSNTVTPREDYYTSPALDISFKT
jgi:hypothetical protein